MDFVGLILFALPAYFANAVPVLLGGGTPLDFGKNFYDSERVFGNGKTIRGFIAGVAAGALVGGLVAMSLRLEFFENTQTQFFGAVALAFGTMVGDALGSFVKRRMHIKTGKPFLPDSLVFLAVALLFAYPFTKPIFYTVFNVGFIVVLTIILHPLANFVANRIGLKRVPW